MSFEEIHISATPGAADADADPESDGVANGVRGRERNLSVSSGASDGARRGSSVAAAFFGVSPQPPLTATAPDAESTATTFSALSDKVSFRSIVERKQSLEKKKRVEAQESRQDILAATDVLAKPFNFVSGMVSTKRRNPLKKKSGILNVLSSQGQKRRIVRKDGQFNLQFDTHGKAHRLLSDIFISSMQLGWTLIFLGFAVAFFGSWLLFAIVWYLTALQHGDFEEVNLTNDSFVPCVAAIEDFTSCFLFSIETQHTIGYGGRATTEQCPFAIIVMGLQSLVGVILQACLTGIVFAKFTLPTKRSQAIMYSRNAVITLRNGVLNLLVQVTDLRKTPLMDCRIRMVLVMRSATNEGEVIPFDRTELECSSELSNINDRLFLSWPCIVSHKIDEESPLYEFRPSDILRSDLELIVALEGTTEETGNNIQARTSYLPNEILWGYRFEHESMVYDKKRHTYDIRHTTMNKTVVDDTPKLSAKEIDQL